MSFYILNPWAFLLFLALPLVVLIAMKSLAGLSAWRHWAALGVRLVIMSLLILALAEIQVVRKSNRLSVMFVLDHSKSIPISARRHAWNLINQEFENMHPRQDRLSLLVFGKDSSLEFIERQYRQKFTRIYSIIDERQTDIAQALRLALAALPEDGQRRIVLISDGNETQGRALEQARNARVNEVTIDVIPFDILARQEVLVDKFKSPSEVHENEPFELSLVIKSNQRTTATVQVFMDDQVVAVYRHIALDKGKNTVRINMPAGSVPPGFRKFRAVVESSDDLVVANNVGYAFVHVRGQPRVLYIESDLANSACLRQALTQVDAQDTRIKLVVRGVDGLPDNILSLQGYDALILSNVSARMLSAAQMQMIEKSVKEAGLGLVMIGGENSFGAGGYQGTPIERALPVDMDITNKKVIPNGALAMIMHSCEFANGNTWAKRISKRAIEVLSDYDLVGILFYGWNSGEQWLFKMQTPVNRGYLYNLIDQMQPGDMPSFNTTLKMAYQGLMNVQAGVRHVVIISDGDPARPSKALMDRLRRGKITVSTIAIQPHGGFEQQLMKYIAAYTGGRYYLVNNPRRLPEIFIKEALEVKRSLIFEKTLQPQLAYHTPPVSGIARGAFPKIQGYVLTSAKPLAKVPLFCAPEKGQQDPLLAHMLYGLGRSVAFTSDAKNRWGAAWVSWPQYNQFWNQTLRWVMRKVEHHSLHVSSFYENGRGKILIDAIRKGRYLNLLKIVATIVTPKFNVLKVAIPQQGPGRYLGSFKADEIGVYLINLSYQDQKGEHHYCNTGLTVPFSPEYRFTSTNHGLLRQIARISGGRELIYEKVRHMDQNQDGEVSPQEWQGDPAEFKRWADSSGSIDLGALARRQQIFQHDKPRGGRPRDLWPLLLTAMILLFPLDVFLRRVLIDYAKLWARGQELLHRLIGGGKAATAADTTMTRLSRAKQAARGAYAHKAWDLKALEKMGQDTAPSIPTKPTSPPTTGPSGSSPSSNAAAAPTTAPGTQADASEADSYTGRLLKAKKRARHKHR